MLACVRTVADTDTLLPVCARLTPCIERHPKSQDALVLDLSGCERLVLGGHSWPSTPTGRIWPVLAARLHRRLSEAMGAPVAVGLGPSRAVAWLAAASACPASWKAVAPSQVAEFLRPLPIAELLTVPDWSGMPGAADVLERLAQGGILTIGQAVRLPITALWRRFGPLGVRLAALAAGRDVTPLRVRTPAPWMGVRVSLAPPVAIGQLPSVIALLADPLAAALHARDLVAGALALVLHGDDRANWRTTRYLGQPTASAAALLDHAERLLATLADGRVDLSELTCAAVHLRVGSLRPLPARQDVLWASQAERDRSAARARLLAPDGPLAHRTGGARLIHAALVAPDAVLPEDRYAFAPLRPLQAA